MSVFHGFVGQFQFPVLAGSGLGPVPVLGSDLGPVLVLGQFPVSGFRFLVLDMLNMVFFSITGADFELFCFGFPLADPSFPVWGQALKS